MQQVLVEWHVGGEEETYTTTVEVEENETGDDISASLLGACAEEFPDEWNGFDGDIIIVAPSEYAGTYSLALDEED